MRRCRRRLTQRSQFAGRIVEGQPRSRDHGAQYGTILTSCRKLIAHGALGGDGRPGLAYLLEDQVKPLIADSRLVRVLGDWCALFPGVTSTIRADGAFALLVEALRFRGGSASRLGGAARLALEHVAMAYRFDGLWSYWASLTKRGRTVRVSANGDGDDDNSDDDDNTLVANRSSCRDYRARNSDSLHSDRTGRTNPDCK